MKRIIFAFFLTMIAATPALAQLAHTSDSDMDKVQSRLSGAPVVIPLPGNATLDNLHTLQAKAADGDADSQFSLGFLFAQGYASGKQDYAEAARWFRKAADQGNANAQTDLGFLFAQGNGVKQDYAEAAQWFRKAADKGDALAQYNLGLLYANGNGVKQSWQDAALWYQRAAAQWKPQE